VNHGAYDAVIDRKVTSAEGKLHNVAQAIRDAFLAAVKADAQSAGHSRETRIKLKNDRYRQLRGGRARLIEIRCITPWNIRSVRVADTTEASHHALCQFPLTRTVWQRTSWSG